jgi:predicted  nucleic acid-binding Zn-ribbon protein
MSDPQVTKRLDRLETKIDKITDVLTSLARVEEQIIGQNARLKRHEWRLDENEKKIEETAEVVAKNAATAKTAEKVFFSIWAALVGYVTWLFKG